MIFIPVLCVVALVLVVLELVLEMEDVHGS